MVANIDARVDNWHSPNLSQVKFLPLRAPGQAHVPVPTTVGFCIYDFLALHHLSYSITPHNADRAHGRRHSDRLRNRRPATPSRKTVFHRPRREPPERMGHDPPSGVSSRAA
jgi:hypothetical protein